jgi:hypothetical protein
MRAKWKEQWKEGTRTKKTGRTGLSISRSNQRRELTDTYIQIWQRLQSRYCADLVDLLEGHQ